MPANVQNNFDMVVIGAGPGGYVCAIRAAQLGMRVACIDKRGAPGGTCLNIGCIPSKALLYASEQYAALGKADKLGIKLGTPKLDMKALQLYKNEAISGNTQGVQFLFRKNKIEEIDGAAEITAPGKISIALRDGTSRIIEAKHIVIATGSEVTPLAGVEVDEDIIVSSTGALDFTKVPKKLLIIGAGIIGLELGSVWARLGTDVTVVEFLDRITPGTDAEIAKQFQRILQRQGIKFKLGTKVIAATKSKTGAKITVKASDNRGDEDILSADKVLLAIGRKAYTHGLGLEALGVETDKAGRIVVDARFKTAIAGVYAIGDVIAGPMLAHKAEEEGVALAEHLAGKAGHVDYDIIPSIIYTDPEVAWIGKTEEELKAANIDYVVGKFPFMANGRAKATQATDGFVKILADKASDRVLGVHIIGSHAGDMIAEAAVALTFSASAEDIARICHAHPTYAEAMKEAALAVDGRALHM